MADSKTPGPLSRFGFFFLVGGVVLIGVFWGILQYVSEHRPHTKLSTKNTAAGIPAPGASGENPPVSIPKVIGPDPVAVAQLRETISQALAVLRDSQNPKKSEALDALRQALKAADPKVALAAIRQFLATGEDAATGLGFKVGEDHELDEAPSMRTFLMDQLGLISRDISAGDAAEIARATLETKSSPDEWAVAMRNLAWADPEGSKALLAAKATELINYAPWQQSPTGGYYEAFDAFAYVGDPGLIATLAPLASSSTSPNLQRAAQIALQRLSAMSPDTVPAYLNEHPNVLADSPGHRADYMGNVDLSNASGVAQAETYLNRTDVTAEEKIKFLDRLGTPASFVSPTLLTPESISNITVMDHRVLVNSTATGWLASGKYPSLQAPLENLVTLTKP